MHRCGGCSLDQPGMLVGRPGSRQACWSGLLALGVGGLAAAGCVGRRLLLLVFVEEAEAEGIAEWHLVKRFVWSIATDVMSTGPSGC